MFSLAKQGFFFSTYVLRIISDYFILPASSFGRNGDIRINKEDTVAVTHISHPDLFGANTVFFFSYVPTSNFV